MRELELNGTYFRCGKMPTRVQLHVVKRLMPVMQGMLPLFAVRRDADGNPVAGVDGMNVYQALAILANTVGDLSDTDADFVLDAALGCVAWRQGAGWQPLRAPGGVFMVGGVDRLDVQLRLLWEVLQESLSDFSLELLLPFLSSTETGNGMDREEETEQTPDMPPVLRRPTAGLNS